MKMTGLCYCLQVIDREKRKYDKIMFFRRCVAIKIAVLIFQVQNLKHVLHGFFGPTGCL